MCVTNHLDILGFESGGYRRLNLESGSVVYRSNAQQVRKCHIDSGLLLEFSEVVDRESERNNSG